MPLIQSNIAILNILTKQSMAEADLLCTFAFKCTVHLHILFIQLDAAMNFNVYLGIWLLVIE